jgi:hypothetical protein
VADNIQADTTDQAEAAAHDRLAKAITANVAAPAPKKAAAKKASARKRTPAPKKAEAHSEKYVVLLPFVGQLTRGDVVTEAQLGSDPVAMIKEKSIRRATAKEAETDYVEHPDGSPWDKLEEKK